MYTALTVLILYMAFRSGQYYMNFINTLKLFTANIKSFDMKSNCTNENQIILPNLSNYMSKGISLKRTRQVNLSNINPSPSANKYVGCPKIAVQKFNSKGNGSKHLKNRGSQEHGSELRK